MEKDALTSHAESLEIIQRMINQAKNKMSENGHLYLLWGWVIFVCSIIQFVLLEYTRFDKHYLVWLVCWLVVIYQFFYLSRRARKKQVRTYTDYIVGYVWLTFMIAMCLMGFLFGAILGEEYYRVISPGYLVLYGIPTFLSGIILWFRPLIVGGIGCWVLSLVSLFIPAQYQLLLISAAMLVAWIIPGYLLRARYLKTEMAATAQ